MAKIYYKYHSLGRATIPSDPTPSRIYTLYHDGSNVYGLDDNIYNYVFRRVDSASYTWFYANQGTTLNSSTRINIAYGGNVSTPRISIYYAVDEGSQWDNFMRSRVTPVTLGRLNGKYRIISNRANNYHDTLTASYTNDLNFIPIITDFTIGDTLYKGFIITGGVSSSNFTGNNIKLIREDRTVETYTVINFASTYSNSIIEFADTEIPKTVVDWFLSFLDVVYPYTYTVKDYTGEITLGEITESPPMSNALLTVIGNQKTLTLTGINGVEYPIQWTSETMEGKQFTGLANNPESNKVSIPVNIPLEVSFVGNITWYEGYGKYRPPVTTFDINLYQNSAEVNQVDKGQFLVGVGTLSGALREECSMLTPSIVYQSSDVPKFNYVYIPIFNRYYFVTSLSSVSKNVWRMELNCDVLMTYKDQILLLQGVIGRQEIDFNPLLVDNELPTQNNPIVEVIDIPSDAFNTQTSDAGHNYVITVIGA